MIARKIVIHRDGYDMKEADSERTLYACAATALVGPDGDPAADWQFGLSGRSAKCQQAGCQPATGCICPTFGSDLHFYVAHLDPHRAPSI
jgi:hypothetical protein